MKLLLMGAACIAAASASAQEATDSSHTLDIYGGQSILMLGSRDHRVEGGFSYAAVKREPRISFGSTHGGILYDSYFEYSHGVGPQWPADDAEAIGGLVMARWSNGSAHSGQGFFTDIGVGLQMADRSSYDLPSELNSTPAADLGVQLPISHRSCQIAVRYLHISNAGTYKPNRGQNEFFLMFSVKV